VEGWAHVWDAAQATAVAVADFGRASQDSIAVHESSRLEVTRTFTARSGPARPAGAGAKELLLWLHFVDAPPHVGAVTSPQAMLAPLEASGGDR